MKLLSIAIPTYNRSSFLNEELENIIPQILPYRDDIEIVVSDNASSDNTGEMLLTLTKKYGFPIKYIRLEKGIYFEDNFANAVEHSEGKYIQLTGDDDIMAPSFYEELYKLLKKGFGLIHFNRLVCDVKCDNGILYDKQYDCSLAIYDAKDFVARVGSGPGFMTSLVFSRECWNEGLKHANNLYYGYNFLGQLYQAAIHLNKRCCYYNFPMILQRGNAHGFNTTYPLYHFVALPNIIKDANADYSEIWIDQHLRGKATLFLLECNQNKAFYREHSEEMLRFLTLKQKLIFRFMISKNTPTFICKIFIKFLVWCI